MNTNDLKIFEAVATNGSFTKAAEAMFTVQSNVTARIKNLEEEFGADLFTRTSRKVTLTSAGETLLQYSKRIDHLVHEAKQDIKKFSRVSGSLKIGCIETTMAFKVPDILTRFTDTYPDVDLEFRSQMRSDLISDVINYKLDAAFVSAPINSPELEQVHIKEEQLVILAPAQGLELKELLTSSPLKIIVFDQGCVFRARLEAWLNSKGIIQYKSIVLNSLEGIINFVEAGLGISILPAELIEQYYAGRKLKTHTLNKELGTMSTVLIYRKNIPQSKPLKAFVEMY
ncbi:LysR family transcriptional regulator [Mucilaginibacter rubeus]|uniref:LysR family transcriptional regulator n=1 Tax=Mucilaginibacter rubeus TaxID=2027860 RepID=A0AAE6JLG5_9SPHI|nr:MULTISPECIES: LysR family transcriptional regulator [Mucilaginibacter]QEM07705.1 LysR family transcriptional regulator [Mucilaginibacter rubeus]QEM20157.1 LysR family transcriptional regulator [Mucilaginibacter gossypii]QTE43129.1 LysR family transcriptional regulator [Mucilaginibacter rubeus]QTE49729.1 LysR family transcriptional regulator [Mucilaginibacter rubeus]QTE54822.1 LysR family transcriptional regulator [Mucilaginibacter rubeus]